MFVDNHASQSKNSSSVNNSGENRPLLLTTMPSPSTVASLERPITTTATNYSSCHHEKDNRIYDNNGDEMGGSHDGLSEHIQFQEKRQHQRRRRYSFPPPISSSSGVVRRLQLQDINTITNNNVPFSSSILPMTTTATTNSAVTLYEKQLGFGRTKMDSVFSSVRSMSTHDEEEIMNDSEKYMKSSLLRKAFPERFLALIVTLIIEIPTLMMISGGSARLCFLLGRNRYQLLVSFLPLASAISGNCGLQASTLTTRGISHEHITRHNFFKGWFVYEILAGLYMGIGMGIVIGLFAFVVSGYDVSFAATIGIAQVLSIFTAGITGTSAPLLFTYVFHQDCGKWGGPIETAVQDIVGSFAMVILSYHLLTLFGGSSEVAPDDVCGEGGTY